MKKYKNLNLIIMKKIILTITAILFFAVTYATDKVGKNVERSFQSEFPGATHISWSKVDNSDLYAVRFVYGHEAMMAFFNKEGNYLAIAKSIPEENLPVLVKRSFSKINVSGALATIEQINMNGETSYLFRFKEEGLKKTYHINEDGSIKRIKIKDAILRDL
jgi:hypothetical protein